MLTRILQPLWSVAVAVARDEQAEAQAAVAAANSASRKSSLSAARAFAAVASAHDETVARGGAVKESDAFRTAAHAAELAAAEASSWEFP